MPKPSIGRIVHAVQKIDTNLKSEIPNVNPALIVQVHDKCLVDLTVFTSTGIYHLHKVPHSKDKSARGTWHWPCHDDSQNS